MVARGPGFFTTEQVARLIGLEENDKWRVIKFTEGEEYEIKPAFGPASGPGTRRFYDLENVCEFALALRLLETGLRSKAIGKVIRQLRKKETLSSKLEIDKATASKLFLAIIRRPETGRPLKGEQRHQEVHWVRGIEAAENIRKKRPNDDLIFVPLGSLFLELNHRLQQIEKRKGESYGNLQEG